MSEVPDETPTFRALVTAFTDFLTVAVHTILYERRVYPQTSFLSARKYNFAIRQSRHPKVCEWINDAVSAVETELLKSTVDKVAIVIYTAHNRPLERFVFDVSRFPVVPNSDIDIPMERPNQGEIETAVLPMVDLEEQLRATMSRLSNCSSELDDLPKGCTFTVVMELKPSGEAPLAHPQHWMPVQNRTNRGNPTDHLKHINNGVTPVRTVQAGEMVFEAWVERVDRDRAASKSTSTSFD